MTDLLSSPLISIALCTFNGDKYLADQLESVIAQTWKNIEIVIVDDDSKDGTRKILEEAAARDPRIRLSFNEINVGFVANFARVLSLCRGSLIAPCDQDDIWCPEKIERLQAEIGSHSLIYCDSELIDEEGLSLNARISDRFIMYEGSDPVPFTFWNCISGHAMLFRSDLLVHALPIPDVKFHDWWLAFIAASTGSIKYLDQPLVFYRQHGRSQTDVLNIKRKTPRGALQRFNERADWISVMANFKSSHQNYFLELNRLWLARQFQWFCPSLFFHLRRHLRSLILINKRESPQNFALKQFFGMKFRLLRRGN